MLSKDPDLEKETPSIEAPPCKEKCSNLLVKPNESSTVLTSTRTTTTGVTTSTETTEESTTMVSTTETLTNATRHHNTTSETEENFTEVSDISQKNWNKSILILNTKEPTNRPQLYTPTLDRIGRILLQLVLRADGLGASHF